MDIPQPLYTIHYYNNYVLFCKGDFFFQEMSHFAPLKRYIGEGGDAMQDETIYTWYQQYKVGLFRFALSILKDSHLAEDALQETLSGSWDKTGCRIPTTHRHGCTG